MKSLLLSIFALFIFVGAQAQETVSAKTEGAVITFQEKAKDFGDITVGDKVEHTFKFKNTGNIPLIISNVAVTCGCTATDWPKKPIAPGAESEITVKFDSSNKNGKQNSIIRVYSNATQPIEKISMISNVLPKK
ncbi:DUF1573 domain-containing protein [Penaeicola halotolerans]|uniref:DUF1573 domain-containing protein n=1 Tax=Penaeicola halotolerans TaxID=2793196 RepID=UPI001CF857B7|nr:DUF1573 domain-containing protein [Penaeicola halotolerans]